MGYDQRPPSGSSGVVIGVILAVLLVGFLGLVAVGGVAFFWLSAVSMETQEAIVAEEWAVAEAYLAEATARDGADAPANVEQEGGAVATPDPRPDFRVTVDAEGNVSVDGEHLKI